MGWNNVTIEPVLDRMVEATSGAMVWDEIQDYFAWHGFDRVIYADLSSRTPVILNTYPEGFGQYYADVCNPQDDPFFRYCCSKFSPQETGADYLHHYDYLTENERRVIMTARESGMRAGFSCTNHKAEGQGMSGWNIGSSLPSSEVDAIRNEHGVSLRLAALYAHERMQTLRSEGQPLPGLALSARELDCLAHLASGLRTQQIADRLGIAPVTVEMHFRRAREKLQAGTREQALAKAISRGILTL